MQRNSSAKWTILLAANIISVMWLVGQVVGQIFKHYNPSHVDVNQGLAYLRQILLSAMLAGIVMLVATLLCNARARAEGEQQAAHLATQIVGIQVAIVVLVLLSTAIFKT